MNLSEFVENHCIGKQYDSCVQSPCAFASTSGCRNPLHPKNTVEQNMNPTGLETKDIQYAISMVAHPKALTIRAKALAQLDSLLNRIIELEAAKPIVQRTAAPHEHLQAEFDYICASCGDLVKRRH